MTIIVIFGLSVNVKLSVSREIVIPIAVSLAGYASFQSVLNFDIDGENSISTHSSASWVFPAGITRQRVEHAVFFDFPLQTNSDRTPRDGQDRIL